MTAALPFGLYLHIFANVQTHMLDAAADEVADFLRAMAHPARLRIICALLSGESTAGMLAERAGILAPALSQQAVILEAEGLIARRRVGQSILYRLASVRARRLAQFLERIYCKPARRVTRGVRPNAVSRGSTVRSPTIGPARNRPRI